MLLQSAIKTRAAELGFDICGVAPATELPELARLREWLDAGHAGEMVYLHKSADTRADIRKFLPSAKSVIVTGTVYYSEDDVDDRAGARSHMPRRDSTETRIARYAWGEDYHVVLAERLENLVAWMREQTDTPFDASIFVDKHHVQERAYARHAGLGWIGKNTCLINPDLGSWMFLAGVAVSLELTPDEPVMDQCGACTLCIDSCPTGALADAYLLDATKCISYLTIELKGEVPEAQRAAIASHAYGCDICQDVCPWNLAPSPSTDAAWRPRQGRAAADAAELWHRSDFDLHAMVAGSAMTRVTLSRLRRNLAIVLGNSGDPAMAAVLDRPGGGVRRAAQSAETPLVRTHVEWARRRLAEAETSAPASPSS